MHFLPFETRSEMLRGKTNVDNSIHALFDSLNAFNSFERKHGGKKLNQFIKNEHKVNDSVAMRRDAKCARENKESES